jgi:hypothetical protein
MRPLWLYCQGRRYFHPNITEILFLYFFFLAKNDEIQSKHHLKVYMKLKSFAEYLHRYFSKYLFRIQDTFMVQAAEYSHRYFSKYLFRIQDTFVVSTAEYSHRYFSKFLFRIQDTFVVSTAEYSHRYFSKYLFRIQDTFVVLTAS